MSNNKIIKKHKKDYPANVPMKLFKLLKYYDFNRSLLALAINVNGGTISLLLNKGIEPTDQTELGRLMRKRLFLHVYKSRKPKTHRTPRTDQPQYVKDWSHLPKEERHRVMKEYTEWKKQAGN